MENKYIIPDITTGEPIEVTEEVFEAYHFLMDNIKAKEETFNTLFKPIIDGPHPDLEKLSKIKKPKNGKI